MLLLCRCQAQAGAELVKQTLKERWRQALHKIKTEPVKVLTIPLTAAFVGWFTNKIGEYIIQCISVDFYLAAQYYEQTFCKFCVFEVALMCATSILCRCVCKSFAQQVECSILEQHSAAMCSLRK
jgi:hypothetical protein